MAVRYVQWNIIYCKLRESICKMRVHEIQQFQDHFAEYKIVVYGGLNCENIIFEGKVKRVNLLYDDVTRDYHVIANLTGAMSKRYTCEGCSKSCRSGVTQVFGGMHRLLDHFPCISTDVRIPCGTCNRTFRSQASFEKHKTNMLKGKPVCLKKRNCGKCNSPLIPMHKHECFKQYCSFCQQNREVGHYSYMRPLKNELPRSDNLLFGFMSLKRHKTQS